MRDLKELGWTEGAETVSALIDRLTVMRPLAESEPMQKLRGFCRSLLAGDLRRAFGEVYAITSSLLTCGARRVTGELFKDLLLDGILLKNHPFALMAAENRLDEAIYNAMREDLDLLSALRELDGATLVRWLGERYRELKKSAHPTRDLAARRAEAAWGGSPVRPAEEEEGPTPMVPAYLPTGEPNWHYGEQELRDSYVSDEALEEMYHRFFEAGPDWSGLTEDLWNFFASYGCGEFLRYKDFIWNGSLSPLESFRTAEKPIFEAEYRECLKHLIAFMRGETSEPLELIGADGMGKTTMLFSLASELPEMRFVYVKDAAPGPLFDALKKVPLKFMTALDDADAASVDTLLVPENVLVFRTAKKPSAGFTKRVVLPELKLDSFADIVTKLLDRDGVDLPRDIVRAFSVDHQVESKGEMTVAAARMVADAVKNSKS